MFSITFGDFTSNLSEEDVLRLQHILYGVNAPALRHEVKTGADIAACTDGLQNVNLAELHESVDKVESQFPVDSNAKAEAAKCTVALAKPSSWAALVASKQSVAKNSNEPVRNGEVITASRAAQNTQVRNGPMTSDQKIVNAQTVANGTHVTNENRQESNPKASVTATLGTSNGHSEMEIDQDSEPEISAYLEQLRIDLVSAENMVKAEIDRLDALADRTATVRKTDRERPHFQNDAMPCTLRNMGNTCYVNSVLQALFNSGAFLNVLRSITVLPSLRDVTEEVNELTKRTPFIDAIVELSRNFLEYLQPLGNDQNALSHTKLKEVLRAVCTVEPRQLLHSVDSRFATGTQNDAEEFYSFLINALHDEMVLVANRGNRAVTASESRLSSTSAAVANSDDSDWFCVDGRRTVVLRDAVARAQRDSPVSRVFSGLLRNTFTYREASAGAVQRDASANVQPFFCLQLDVGPSSNVVADSPSRTIFEALSELFTRESVEQGGCLRRTTLDHLPAVLVLHVKCFAYVSLTEGADIVKLFRALAIDTELQIPSAFLTGTAKQNAKTASNVAAAKRGAPKHSAIYRIRSIIFHHGAKLQNGHYTCMAYHDALNSWLQFDDDVVRAVRAEDALSYWRTWPSSLLSGAAQEASTNVEKLSSSGGESAPISTRNGPRMPYLLFYERIA